MRVDFVPAERLHSRYNPRAEAERYIDALKIDAAAAYFILIEPGLGYLIPALRSRYAHSKIVVLHADQRFRACAAEPPDVPVWYPGGGETVQCFLEREIPDAAASRIRIIEWRPSLSLYGESCLRLIAESAEFIKRADAGFRTASVFGGRWVRNFFRNLRLIRRVLRFRPMAAPVIISGAGPGLETALPRIRAMGGAFILAASSSVPALYAGGIRPDMVIGADGGSWALSHLYCLFRRSGAGAPLLAAACSAALPSQCAALPVLALNDGSLWQSLVLGELGIPSVIIPQRGTVTASALELALTLSTGPVYLAGMDLSVRDIRTHARPYGFDHIFFGGASRLRPVYSQYFARSGETRAGGSHDIYAAWFKERLAHWPRRIFSLGNNHPVFEPEAGEFAHNGKAAPFRAGDAFTAVDTGGEPAANCRRGADALCRALEDPRYANILRDELAPLLFPGGPDASIPALREALQDMAARGGREYRG